MPSSKDRFFSFDKIRNILKAEKVKLIGKEVIASIGLLICTFSCAILAARLMSGSLGTGIALAVMALFFALADLVYVAKLLSYTLPCQVRKIAGWIHAQSLEVFYLLGCHTLFFLSIRNWKWNVHLEHRPLLLVHGYMNYNTVWLFHAKRLKKAGFGPIFTLNLGYPFRSIEGHAEKVKQKAEHIAQETGRNDLILIGHSMGGLVSSYYATELAEANTVTDVVTIASPLQGTHVARIGAGKCALQMRRQSDFVDELSQEILKSSFTRYYHIATELDQLVIPYHSSLLGDHFEHHYILDDIGHIALLFSEKVNRKIIEWLLPNYYPDEPSPYSGTSKKDQ